MLLMENVMRPRDAGNIEDPTQCCCNTRTLGGALNFCSGGDVWCRPPNGGLKNWFSAKVRSKERNIFNILRAYELKFGPNLGCKTENPLNFWQFFLTGVKIYYFCLKWRLKNWIMLQLGSKERREKGVLTARQTRTTFPGECPPPRGLEPTV